MRPGANNNNPTQHQREKYVLPDGMVGLTRSEKLQPWYAGPMSRADAENILANAPNGTFLVRDSDKRPGQFDISASVITRHFAPPTYLETLLPTFLGGRAPEPAPRPTVKHFKVLINQSGRKNLFSLAPKERRKWWSMQQLIDFFGTDSLERHFVGVKANLSTPFQSAEAVRQRNRQRRPKPLLSKVPSNPEDRGRRAPLPISVALLCTIAVAWTLLHTGRDGNVWHRCSQWFLALTTSKEAAIKTYGFGTFVAVLLSVAFFQMKPRQEASDSEMSHEASEPMMTQLTAEQAVALSEDSTWDDMTCAAQATPPETNKYFGSDGTIEEEDTPYDVLDFSEHVVCRNGNPKF